MSSISLKWVYKSQLLLDKSIRFSLISFIPWRSVTIAQSEWLRLHGIASRLSLPKFWIVPLSVLHFFFSSGSDHEPFWLGHLSSEYKASHTLTLTPSCSWGHPGPLSLDINHIADLFICLSWTHFPLLSAELSTSRARPIHSVFPLQPWSESLDGFFHHLSSMKSSFICCFGSGSQTRHSGLFTGRQGQGVNL